MGIFHKVIVGNQTISPIDWDMNPDSSFGTFESWGGRERVRNNSECVYYFFIDNWGEEPKLCLMERAVKHAKIMAEIVAPLEMVRQCVSAQGRSSIFEQSCAINEQIKQWLIDNVLDNYNTNLIVPLVEESQTEDMGPDLPQQKDTPFTGEVVLLASEQATINDDEIAAVVQKWNFYDSEYNPSGQFDNALAATIHPHVVFDQRTSLSWMQGGIDICSIRSMQKHIEKINKETYAGYTDWRTPTIEEALSLMEKERNNKGLFLNPCFSMEQPFIFVAAKRKPGGYWFVDYKQGRAFWSSGTIPGGFGRLVRSV